MIDYAEPNTKWRSEQIVNGRSCVRHPLNEEAKADIERRVKLRRATARGSQFQIVKDGIYFREDSRWTVLLDNEPIGTVWRGVGLRNKWRNGSQLKFAIWVAEPYDSLPFFAPYHETWCYGGNRAQSSIAVAHAILLQRQQSQAGNYNHAEVERVY